MININSKIFDINNNKYKFSTNLSTSFSEKRYRAMTSKSTSKTKI